MDGVIRGEVGHPGQRVLPEISISRLPVTSRDLFGRQSELDWLDRCWAEDVRVASIVAWGGVGKSALVNAWLRRMDDARWRGAGRVFGWSFYNQGTDRLSSSDEFVEAALRWFGDTDPSAGCPWDKGERLARLVRRERAIVVLDGMEPLQWGPPGPEAGKIKDPALQALVRDLAAGNRGLCLIATRIAVKDLVNFSANKVQQYELEHLCAEAGTELLKAKGARGLEEDLQAAAVEYGGHSLALTLLGSYVWKRHHGDIRQRLRIPLLEGEPVHRVMGIYERWFARKPEIAVLRMLGLFDRPTSAGEIAALRAEPHIRGLSTALRGLAGGRWNEVVATLQDVGLLAPSAGGDDWLDAHPLVREHFGKQLRSKYPAAWREGHRRLYEYLVAAAKDLPETLGDMTPLYSAMVHGCLAGESQSVYDMHYRMVRRGYSYFSIRKLGAFGSEAAALSAFFDPPWERFTPGLSERAKALVVSQAGFALRALGHLTEASRLMQQGLDLLVAQATWADASRAAANLSELLQARGELREALALARRTIEYADKCEDLFWHVASRTALAATLHAMGRRQEAAVYFDDAESRQREHEPDRPLLYALRGFQYSDFLLDEGRVADVLRRAAPTLEWVKAEQRLLHIALGELSLGRAHFLASHCHVASDRSLATDHLNEAVHGLRRYGDQDYLPLGLLARAVLHVHTRAFNLAHNDLDEAFSLATRCGFRLHEADAHLAYVRLCLAEGNPAAARRHFDSARQIVEQTGYHRRDAELAELKLRLYTREEDESE